ncbi:MAG: hypothetical protein ACXVO9_01520 [Bacteroidia bacterium]
MIVWFFALACNHRSIYNANEKHGSNSNAGTPKSDLKLDPAEFVKWCRDEENGLLKSKEIGDITFSLQFKPAEYVICMEQKTNMLSSKVLSEGLNELDGMDYYDFKIEITSGEGELLKHNSSSVAGYNERVNYFAFEMQKDLKLINGTDTLDCKLFHFERAYDVAPYTVFLMAFPKIRNENKEVVFLYEDKVFKKGIIKFTYSKEELTQIPKLKTI